VLGQFVPNNAGATYDWIGFDPRGVGASTPSLSCIPDYFGYNRPYYVPVTRVLERTWLERSESYADACQQDAAALLPHMKTTDSARDMESIRKALGARQINYYGFSYGTYLAQVSSTLFPSRVRRMALDNPGGRPDRRFGVDRRLPAGGLQPVLLAVPRRRLRRLGAQRRRAGAQGRLRRRRRSRRRQPLAVYLAVDCTDARWPTNWNRWRRDNRRLHAKYPFFTWGNAWFNAPCVFWHAPSGTPVRVNGRHVPGILLIDETLDAATPFAGSLEVRRRYPRASLIAEPGGTSHANSLSGNACVDDQIAAYLAEGTLPPRKPGNRPDAICAPLPQPVPTAESASSMASANSGVATRLRQLASRPSR
jgi:pimeloyl-ACP methyl ester carboxylesterase